MNRSRARPAGQTDRRWTSERLREVAASVGRRAWQRTTLYRPVADGTSSRVPSRTPAAAPARRPRHEFGLRTRCDRRAWRHRAPGRGAGAALGPRGAQPDAGLARGGESGGGRDASPGRMRCRVRGLSNRDAAAAADIVVVTVPFAVQESILEDIRPWWPGKLVVDTTVPLVPPKVMRVQLPAKARPLCTRSGSLGDTVTVVSAFHNVAAHKLATRRGPSTATCSCSGTRATRASASSRSRRRRSARAARRVAGQFRGGRGADLDTDLRQ